MLRAELDAAVEPGDNRELIFVPWVYRLGDECPDPDDAILFRCWCPHVHSHITPAD